MLLEHNRLPFGFDAEVDYAAKFCRKKSGKSRLYGMLFDKVLYSI